MRFSNPFSRKPAPPPAAAEAASAKAGPAPEARHPVANLASVAASSLAIANAADAILRAGGAKLGLADWSLLQRLAASAELQPIGRVARQMGVSRQRVQKQVDTLAQAGLVDSKADSEDKRVRMLSITTAGREALAATARTWAQALGGNLPEAALNLDGFRRRIGGVSAMLAKLGTSGPARKPGEAESRAAGEK